VSAPEYYVAECDPRTGKEIPDSRIQSNTLERACKMREWLADAEPKKRFMLIVLDDLPNIETVRVTDDVLAYLKREPAITFCLPCHAFALATETHSH
jgi:hypothetical protein